MPRRAVQWDGHDGPRCPPELAPEQRAVFEAIEVTREHVFVTGRAGTGKSTLLNHLAWHTSKQIVICAPTGVAALNVGGQTIHSLFRLPIGVIADHEIEQTARAAQAAVAIDTLVIDEVSMVNADLMDAIDRTLRQARGKRAEPFGGVQVVLFGDPYQLAPVPGEGDERAYFADHYRSMWFFDAKVWRRDATSRSSSSRDPPPARGRLQAHAQRRAPRRVTAEIAGRLNEMGARPHPTDGAITLATTNGIGQPDQRRRSSRSCRAARSRRGRDQRRVRRTGVSRPTTSWSSRSARR